MSLPIVASLIILTAGGPAPTLKDVLSQKYKQFNAAILKSNPAAATSWIKSNCSDKFEFKSKQGSRLSRNGFISEAVQEISVTSKVLSSSMTIRMVKQHGDECVATVLVEFQGIVTIDSRKMKMSAPFVSEDTWKKVGKDWKFTKSVQVNAETPLLEPAEG